MSINSRTEPQPQGQLCPHTTALGKQSNVTVLPTAITVQAAKRASVLRPWLRQEPGLLLLRWPRLSPCSVILAFYRRILKIIHHWTTPPLSTSTLSTRPFHLTAQSLRNPPKSFLGRHPWTPTCGLLTVMCGQIQLCSIGLLLMNFG